MRDYWDNLKLFDRNIRYFLLATAVHGFVFFGIFSLLLNLFLLRSGYGPEFIGLVNGTGPLMLGVFSLPAGIFSRRFGSRKVLLWSYTAMALFFILTPLSEFLPVDIRQPWIVIVYACAWIGGAFASVNFGPYLMAWTGEKERNYAFAMQAAAFPVAGFLGNLVGGALPGIFARFGDVTLDSPLPFRNALVIAGVLEMFAVIATKRTAEIDISPETKTPQRSSNSSPPYRLMMLFAVITLFAVAGEWTMRVYFNVYLDQVLSAPTAVIGALSAGAQLMGLAAFLSPKAAAKYGRNRVIILALLLTFSSYIPIILFGHWAAVGMSFMLLVGSMSLYNPTYLVFSQSQVGPQWRTAIASSITTAFGLGIALTSLSGGTIIASYSYQTVFTIGAMASLTGALIFWWFFRSKSSLTPRPPVPSKV